MPMALARHLSLALLLVGLAWGSRPQPLEAEQESLLSLTEAEPETKGTGEEPKHTEQEAQAPEAGAAKGADEPFKKSIADGHVVDGAVKALESQVSKSSKSANVVEGDFQKYQATIKELQSSLDTFSDEQKKYHKDILDHFAKAEPERMKAFEETVRLAKERNKGAKLGETVKNVPKKEEPEATATEDKAVAGNDEKSTGEEKDTSGSEHSDAAAKDETQDVDLSRFWREVEQEHGTGGSEHSDAAAEDKTKEHETAATESKEVPPEGEEKFEAAAHDGETDEEHDHEGTTPDEKATAETNPEHENLMQTRGASKDLKVAEIKASGRAVDARLPTAAKPAARGASGGALRRKPPR